MSFRNYRRNLHTQLRVENFSCGTKTPHSHNHKNETEIIILRITIISLQKTKTATTMNELPSSMRGGRLISFRQLPPNAYWSHHRTEVFGG